MKSIFIICALALPPVAFPPFQEETWYQEAAALYPEKDLWFIKGQELPESDFEKIPHITYRDYEIYMKRSS